jgi:hypothetical protein
MDPAKPVGSCPASDYIRFTSQRASTQSAISACVADTITESSQCSVHVTDLWIDQIVKDAGCKAWRNQSAVAEWRIPEIFPTGSRAISQSRQSTRVNDVDGSLHADG